MPSKKFKLRRSEGDEWFEVTWNGEIEGPVEETKGDDPLVTFIFEDEYPEERIRQLKEKLWRP